MSGKSRRKVSVGLQQSATETTPKNDASVDYASCTAIPIKLKKRKKSTNSLKKKPKNAIKKQRKKSTNIKTNGKKKANNPKKKKKAKPKTRKLKQKNTSTKTKKNSSKKNKEKNMKIFNDLYSMKDVKSKKNSNKIKFTSDRSTNHRPYTPQNTSSHSKINRKPMHSSFTLSTRSESQIPRLDHILTDEQIMINALKDTQMIEQLFLNSKQFTPRKKVSFANSVTNNSPSVSYPNPVKKKNSPKRRKNLQPKNAIIKKNKRSKSMEPKKKKMKVKTKVKKKVKKKVKMPVKKKKTSAVKRKTNKPKIEKKVSEDYSSIHSISRTISNKNRIRSNTMANANLEEPNNRFGRFSLKFGSKKKQMPSESLKSGEPPPKSYRFWHWRRNKSANKQRMNTNGGNSSSSSSSSSSSDHSSDTDIGQPSVLKLSESNKLIVRDRTLSKKNLPKPPKRKKSKLKIAKLKSISKSNDFRKKTKTTANKKKKNTKNVSIKNVKKKKKKKSKMNNTSLPLNLIKNETKKKKKKKLLKNNSIPVKKQSIKYNLKLPSLPNKAPLSDSELDLPHYQFHGRRKIDKAKKFSNRIENNYNSISTSDDLLKIKNRNNNKKKKTKKKRKPSTAKSMKKKKKKSTNKPPIIQIKTNKKKQKKNKDLVTPSNTTDEPVFLNPNEKYDHHLSHKHQKPAADQIPIQMNINNNIRYTISDSASTISINNEDFDIMDNLTLEIAGIEQNFSDTQSIKSSSSRNRSKAWRKKVKKRSHMKKRSYDSSSSYSVHSGKHSIPDMKIAEQMNVNDVNRCDVAQFPNNSNSNSYSYTTGTNSKRYMQPLGVKSMPHDSSCYAIYAEFMKLDSEKKYQVDYYSQPDGDSSVSMDSSYFITGKRISQMQSESTSDDSSSSSDEKQVFRKYGRADERVVNGTHIRSTTDFGYYDRNQEEYEWQRERSVEFSNDYENVDESYVYYDEEKEISYYGSTAGLSSVMSSLPAAKTNEVKNFIRTSFSSMVDKTSSSSKYKYNHDDTHSSNPNSSERLSQDLETFQYLHEIEITYESSDEVEGNGDLLTDFDEESTLSMDDYGYQTD